MRPIFHCLTITAVLTICTSVERAAAVPVTCGQVIVVDTVVDADVGPCASTGIIVGADGITLDLNKRRVFGAVNADNFATGIVLNSRTGVVVKNGKVSGFHAGVSIASGSNNVVSRLTVSDNIGRDGSFGDGIIIYQSTNNTVEASTVSHNGPFSGITITGVASGRNYIGGNKLKDNNIERDAFNNEDTGIRVDVSNHNVIANNSIKGSGRDGIAILGNSIGTTVVGNTVQKNGGLAKPHRKGDGILVLGGANNTVIAANKVSGNAGSGIRVESGSNQIVRNKASGNAGGFDLFDLDVSPCGTNLWFGNKAGSASPDCTRR